METLTLITPTGDRSLAFALCQNWMRKQTLQPDQWIVVDDGKIPIEPYVPMEYVRREPLASDPQCTLSLNLKASLPLIKGNKIMIIEDDDYYAPKYVAEMALRLNQHEIVGIGDSKYYHLPSGGYHRHGNMHRASFAQTAFRASFLPEFKEILNGNVGTTFIDSIIWKKIEGSDRGFIFVDNNNDSLYAGIKGLPGRPGVIGHNPKAYRNLHVDTSRKILRQWIPKNYGIYMDIIKGKLTEKNCQSWIKEMKTIAFITRVHPKRSNMLKICIDSIKAQTSNDYIHILHRDDKTDKGYGKFMANKSFIKITSIDAKYVMVLDDDDMLIDSDFIQIFRKAINGNNPEIVFFKGKINGFGTYPLPSAWKKPPIFAAIASFCFAVRLDIWMKYIYEFGKEEGGDYSFISACYKNTKDHLWLDRKIARTQRKTMR